MMSGEDMMSDPLLLLDYSEAPANWRLCEAWLAFLLLFSSGSYTLVCNDTGPHVSRIVKA